MNDYHQIISVGGGIMAELSGERIKVKQAIPDTTKGGMQPVEFFETIDENYDRIEVDLLR